VINHNIQYNIVLLHEDYTLCHFPSYLLRFNTLHCFFLILLIYFLAKIKKIFENKKVNIFSKKKNI
jgi:hypothetical protein